MNRILLATLLSIWVMFLGAISYGVGDYDCLMETWITSFSLPIWSILTIGLWYDTGRLVIGSTIDSKKSTVSINIRYIFFVLWMSLIFTYVFWVHLNMYSTHMIIMIPILSIPLRDWLIRDWNELTTYPPDRDQIIAISTWLISSWLVYWFFNFAWIFLRVWLLDMTNDGVVYFIE